jgi:hypothetical protein
LLEKRVRSRFSHRVLHCMPQWTFLQFKETLMYYLEADECSDAAAEVVQTYNDHIKVHF